MHSSVSLQPNAVLGTYPERQEKLQGRGRRAISPLARLLNCPSWLHRSRSQRFVALVGSAGVGLGNADEASLLAKAKNLRLRLLGEGLTDDAVATAFALVRELASRRLGMPHYDVQLIGGWVMMQGMLAEMETGEGKTLTATLPACTAALAGIPVHVITVNEYLAHRDATTMSPVYHALGLTVGVVTAAMDVQARREAYACDVTYCTSKQIAFDYLRDRITLGGKHDELRLRLESLHASSPRGSRMNLRGLCFCIVDEADSVLIDEARTPLLIAGPAQGREVGAAYGEALRLARQLKPGEHFLIDQASHTIALTAEGEAQLAARAAPLGGIWAGRRRRRELINQALSALHLYHRDRHYLVREEKVQIIDQHTGRVMADRSWERGLHQMIETKEGCPQTPPQKTLARISFQRFFGRYLRLAGMTGTAREVAAELWTVYRLQVVTIPPNRPVRRVMRDRRVFSTGERKWAAVVASISQLHAEMRPVLVGTRSVSDSEHLSRLLAARQLPHQVLNARHDRREARIVAEAGLPGQITVATNMAGRGTDIALTPAVIRAGGLHVIVTECNDARRIDRQLIGRCARQGDPGSYEVCLSLEDTLVATFCPRTLRWLLERASRRWHQIPEWFGRFVQRQSQRNVELRHRSARAQMQKLDDHNEDMLAFSGRFE